ncbi:DUF6300 family protein [Streptosporangium sp. NBC_01755]|uniref:DUF6300 family protein n=1 Tax=Streptosporangium sp. NBC_01755 TaxID=2975949 RepID=UPI002DDB17E2|nr:DUF6300 family protein [Streptosporangium sp. NBC_01755]WSA27487.1 DUF6300 family protein [Streptosporangium sp. NBC_01810]WSD01042.1 DUF6300 family protein [Streptosporangium sp. NBC_01755]
MTGRWACPRCRTGEVLAVVRLPHTWTNAAGDPVRGIRDALLCACCDAGDPNAGPIITYFAVHGSAQPETLVQLARYLLRWIHRARAPKQPDENALNAEAEAWYRGEL